MKLAEGVDRSCNRSGGAVDPRQLQRSAPDSSPAQTYGAPPSALTIRSSAVLNPV